MNNDVVNFDGDADAGEDLAFESLLSEAITGERPPDLTEQIMRALGRPVEAPPVAFSEVSLIGSDSGARLVANRSEKRSSNTFLNALVGLVSLSACVTFAVIYFAGSEADTNGDRVAVGTDETPRVAVHPKASEGSSEPDGVGRNDSSGPVDRLKVGASSGEANAAKKVSKPIVLDGPNFAANQDADEVDSGMPRTIEFAKPPARIDDQAIVGLIDRRLEEAWAENSITPSSDVGEAELRQRWIDFFGKDLLVDDNNLALSIQKGLNDPIVGERLAGRFAGALLGRTGIRRINKEQFAQFVRFLSPTVSGSARFDSLAEQMLLARGAVDPEVDQFDPATVWMGALAGPQSIALAEQAGHALLDMDLKCGRCHDHPLDGRVWQPQYWQFSAMFETGLRWSVGEDGALRVESTLLDAAPGSGEKGVVFYEMADGRQRAATPKAPDAWILGAGSDLVANDQGLGSGAEELQRLAISMRNNPQLAKAMVNRVWEAVYGRPLVGSSADPTVAPETESLVALQQELAEQFRAHQFDVGRLFSWIAAARPMRLSIPSAWQTPTFDSASAAELRFAASQVRAFAGFPRAVPQRRFKDLLARVDVNEGRLGTMLEAANNFPGGLLGQFQPREADLKANGSTRKVTSTSADQLLRASLETMETLGAGDQETLPTDWLGKVEGPDAFQRRAEHLYYLAGYWHPSPQQLEVARVLRDNAEGDAMALRRLWWVLANESL